MTNKLEQQADLLFANINGWEQSVLERIGKRINKIGKMSVADVQALNNISDVKGDMKEIKKELARVTGMNVRQIEKIYADTLEEQHLANKPLYDYRNKVFVPFSDNVELQALVKAYAKSTAKEMVSLSKTKMLSVRDKNGRFVKMQKGYCDILDKATMQVASGATDFHTAMRESIKQMGSGGLRVDYGGGVTRRLDTVVRQNLLWGAKQASIAYNEMIGEELGCDGIEIDYHANPRPSHADMQGKQYVLGKARVINGIKFESADVPLKLLEEYNCYHYKTPIICGISEPRYSDKELADLKVRDERTFNIDGHEMTGYQASQAMRRLETAVREQKGMKAMYQASGDPLAVRECNERIKRYQDKYAEISDITGIAQDKKRMTLTKSADKIKGTSTPKTPTAPKTTVKKPQKSVKSVDNSAKSGTIKRKDEILKPKIAQGKDLSGKIDYSKGDFNFDIEKAMKEQGFDGLPQVATNEQFKEALRKSNFYAERTYCAPTQDILDAYREQLYRGEWYVDCSTGGAQYGQGMYCAARYENGRYIIPKDNKIGWEMAHYQEIGNNAGKKLYYTEGITLTEDAKIFNLPYGKKAEEYISDAYTNNYMLTHATEEQKETVEKYIAVRNKIENLSGRESSDFIDSLYDEANGYHKQIAELAKEALSAQQYIPNGGKYPKMKNAGTLAVEMGYDAINAIGHGESGSYTVILNRTKCIFREGGSMYGN